MKTKDILSGFFTESEEITSEGTEAVNARKARDAELQERIREKQAELEALLGEKRDSAILDILDNVIKSYKKLMKIANSSGNDYDNVIDAVEALQDECENCISELEYARDEEEDEDDD